MRIVLATLALTALATPAAAQTRPETRVAERLSDPVVQEGIAAAVSALAGIVLDTKVGPLSHYSDRVRPGDTLRDVERREDPRFEARLHDTTRRSVAIAGRTAGDMAAMAGALRVTAARLNAAVAPFVDMARRQDRNDSVEDN